MWGSKTIQLLKGASTCPGMASDSLGQPISICTGRQTWRRPSSLAPRHSPWRWFPSRCDPEWAVNKRKLEVLILFRTNSSTVNLPERTSYRSVAESKRHPCIPSWPSSWNRSASGRWSIRWGHRSAGRHFRPTVRTRAPRAGIRSAHHPGRSWRCRRSSSWFRCSWRATGGHPWAYRWNRTCTWWWRCRRASGNIQLWKMKLSIIHISADISLEL